MHPLIKKIGHHFNVELAPYKYDEREENAYRILRPKLYLNYLFRALS